jgi:hypothetical protein
MRPTRLLLVDQRDSSPMAMSDSVPLDSFAINVDASALRRGAHNITGRIWIDLGGTAFPERDWNDFPVVILGWWLRALQGLLLQTTRSDAFLFMDGPYEYRVAVLDGARWQLHLVRRGHTEHVLTTGTVAALGFASSITCAASELIRACTDRGWSTDVQGLQFAVDRINI